MALYDVETVVSGAGIIELAIARQLCLAGHEVVIIDKSQTFGSGNSSRNSEVIHAGIYYPPSSKKAYHCVRGKRKLYDYCHEKSISFKKLGKFIIATTPDESNYLEQLRKRSEKNGLLGAEELEFYKKNEMVQLEPELECHSALYSPSTGIVDSHALMQSFFLDAHENGTIVSLGTHVSQIKRTSPIQLFGESNGDEFTLTAKNVVVAAGVGTRKISDESNLPMPICCSVKGSYYKLWTTAPFKHLIYPVPSKEGLGIHLTIDLDGRAKFGPDTELINEASYSVSPEKTTLFENEVRKYWPALPDDALSPDYAGIRTKIKTDSGKVSDFMFCGPTQTQVDGLYILHGFESPGLTSCMSIAETIASLLGNTKLK